MKGGFDLERFTAAFETVDVESILNYYADGLEHTEIDSDAPPKAPRVSGKDEIRAAFEGIAQAGMKLRLSNPVLSDDRAACTITVEFPGGGKLMSNTIFELKDGRIARQLDIQVSDPS